MNRIKNTKSTKNNNKSQKKKPNKNTTKQIDINKRPDWYTPYPWSPVPDIVNNFVGRDLELIGFWHEMEKLVGRGSGKKSNFAFVGQRKLGKTAYLKRCYNIAFWEQDEVVPFYYSFPQNDGHKEFIVQLSHLQETMPIQFLQQFFSFCTKDDTFLELSFVEDIFDYLKEIKFPKLERIIQNIKRSLDSINSSNGPTMMLNIWEITQRLSFLMRKKCLLIIDEAQEMDISLYDGTVRRQCKASISDIIQKDHSIVFVSGSNVSMVVNNFLDYSTANRFKKSVFTPLELEDAKKLIEKKCPNGYANLANDLLDIVGGNPYYIGEIFAFNIDYFKEYKTEKDFSSKEGLRKAYDFEVLSTEGCIYDFWNVHIRKNKDDLNQDPKGKKGLALQLLYKISKNIKREFTYPELMKEFGVDEDTLVKKIEQLEHANLIKPMGISRLAHGFPDLVLPVFVNKFYHQLIIEGPSKNISKIAKEDYNNMISGLKSALDEGHIEIDQVDADVKDIKSKVIELKFERLKLKRKVKSAQGKLSLCKGIRRENAVKRKVRDMIEKKQGIFSIYQLEGFVSSINIRESDGTGCEIDIFAKLAQKGKKKKSFALLAEVKNREKKVSMEEADKFLSTIGRAIEEYDLEEVRGVYISVNGFKAGVRDYLLDNGVACASSELVFEA